VEEPLGADKALVSAVAVTQVLSQSVELVVADKALVDQRLPGRQVVEVDQLSQTHGDCQVAQETPSRTESAVALAVQLDQVRHLVAESLAHLSHPVQPSQPQAG